MNIIIPEYIREVQTLERQRYKYNYLHNDMTICLENAKQSTGKPSESKVANFKVNLQKQ